MTTYPAKIDTTITLPSIIDNFTPITGDAFNRLRDTIIRVEQELGTNPKSTYSNVAARIENLENIAASSGVISLTNDLGGTYSVPVVVGLQSHPVTATVPALNNVLTWNGAAWEPLPAQGGAGAEILTFYSDTTLFEVGQTVAGPEFGATYSVTPTITTLTDSDNLIAQDLSSHPTSITSDYSFVKNTYAASVDFTLSATKSGFTNTKSVTFKWGQYIFVGIGTNLAPGDILDFGYAQLTTNRNITITVNAPGTNKIYYAYRTADGPASFSVNGLIGGFTLITTTYSITNSHGFIENYTLYESDNAGLGSVTFTVS
jgi:hypothetical protein